MRRGVGAVGESRWINGGVSVDFALIAANGEDFRDGFGEVEDVGLEVRDGVFVGGVALVPGRSQSVWWVLCEWTG